MKADETENSQDTEFLREAVKFAELHLDNQIAANASHERKAIVFTTSSIAILGYLISEEPVKFVFINFVLIFLPLAVSAVSGVLTVYSLKLGAPGLEPEHSWESAPNTAALMIECLGIYQEKININARTLRAKGILLTVSVISFYTSIISLFMSFFTPIIRSLLAP